MNKTRADTFIQTSIPYRPVGVSRNDLQENGKLLSDETINAIKQAAADGVFSENTKDNNVRVTKAALKAAGIDSNYNVVLVRNSNDVPTIYIEYYGAKRGKHLGKGSFGKVKYVQNAESGAYEAIKLVKTPSIQLQRLTKFESQLTARAGQMIATIQTGSENLQAFIVTLIPGAEAFNLMKADMAPVESMQMAIAITNALARIHNNKLLHADVKPQNVIYNPLTRLASMIDFGLSMPMNERGIKQTIVQGSPLYMPPELRSMLFKRAYDQTPRTVEEKSLLSNTLLSYNFAIDLYSLGVSLGEILKLTEQKSFTQDDMPHLSIKPFDATESHPILTDPDMRERVTTFLQQLTSADPQQRHNLQTVSEFFVEMRDILREQPGNQKEVAIVNIADIEKLDSLALRDYVQLLLPYSAIQLVADHTDISLLQVANIKARLEEYGLQVRDTLVHDDRPLAELISSFAKAEESDVIRSQFSWVHQGSLAESDSLGLASDIKLVEAPRLAAPKNGVSEAVIPYLPRQVDVNDLGPDGMLISAKTRLEIMNKLKSGALKVNEGETVRFSKAQLKEQGLNSAYSIIARNVAGEYQMYAIYRGEKYGRSLGKGASGNVKIVQDLSNGEYFARKAQIGGLVVESQNLETMGRFKFKFEYTPQTEAGKKKYKQGGRRPTSKAYAAVTELAPGVVTSHFTTHPMHAHQMMQMFHSLAVDLQEVHKRGLLHLDIKPDNMLYDNTNNAATLVDFSASVKVGPDGTQNSMIAGTQNYLAPEMLALRRQGKFGSKFSAKQDIYSLGISLAQIAGLTKDNGQVLSLVGESDPEFINNTKIPDLALRSELHALLSAMTLLTPEQRPTIEEVNESLERLTSKLANTLKQKVGILDLKAYEEASRPEKDRMIEVLKKYDQVAVVYSQVQCDMVKIELLKREIEQRGVQINQSLLYGSTSVDLLASKVPLTHAFKDTPYRLKYFSVTTEGEKPIADTSIKVNKSSLFSMKPREAVEQKQEISPDKKPYSP